MPLSILADPFVMEPAGSELVCCSFPLIEGLVLALLLSKYGFRSKRVFTIWLLITVLTYLFFSIAVLIAFSWMDYHLVVGSSIVAAQLSSVVIGELLVILVESKIIQVFSTRAFFREGDRTRLGFRRCLVCSFAVNMVSLLASGAWIWISIARWDQA
jgi:hypothetical protein